MAGKAHRIITKKALGILDGWEKQIWRKQTGKIIDEYCIYPDLYYNPICTSKVLPYILLLDKIPFHYLPNNPIEYNYWSVVPRGKRYMLKKTPEQPNINWLFAQKGFTYYFRKITENLKGSKYEESAKFAGALIHVLEDASACLHCIEGPDGVDIFALDRFLSHSKKMKYLTPSMVLTEADDIDFNLKGYRPGLLGTSIQEAVFNLYQRYCEVISQNRLRMIPIILNTFSGRKRDVDKLRSGVNKVSAQLVADTLHTAFCIAFSRFDKQQVKSLKEIHLTNLKPIMFPRHLSTPYRFTPIVRNYCLDSRRRPVPLKLKLKKQGKIQEVTFSEGMGTGCHVEYTIAYDIPDNIYTRFTCAVGLHSKLGCGGRIKVQVKLCRKLLFEKIFEDNYPASYVKLPVLHGGLLELIVKDKTGNWANPKNNIVWGEPLLVRNPDAPSGID